MKIYGLLAILLAILVQVQSVRRITLDDDSQALCKKYKMMCKTDKICAVQHFDWPSNITIPVCIPLSFVPAHYYYAVRNRICKLPPDTGRCLARYIRWYYNIHSQECTHFQYGGCEGNQNNFMSKTECERTCIATPSIRLYEGQSALVEPSIMTAPVYEPVKIDARVEGLNTGRESVSNGNYDRYEVRRRPNKSRTDEASITRTRRRLDKEREKERKRREKKKEKKRLKKLRREQRKLRCKKRRERGKKCKKDRKGSKKRKNKKKTPEKSAEVENETAKENNEMIKKDSGDMVDETKNIINNEIEDVEEVDDDDDDDKEKDKKRDKRRKKRKLRDKRRHEKDRNRRNLNSRKNRRYSEYSRRPETYSKKLFSILDRDRQYVKQENSLIHTLS